MLLRISLINKNTITYKIFDLHCDIILYIIGKPRPRQNPDLHITLCCPFLIFI